MNRVRVIPILLLKGSGLVKTTKFKKEVYLGDPINTVKIFNEKEVDELVLFDISASKEGREPNYQLIEDVASECFMPLGYGGGISNIEQIKRIFNSGIEKVVLNTAAHSDISLVTEAARLFGSQSIVACIDVKSGSFGGQQVYVKSGSTKVKGDIPGITKQLEEAGIGEIVINSIDRDGTMSGYDIDLIRRVSQSVKVPVIACGGAGSISDFRSAVVEGCASAVAAGAFFVFNGKHRAVLISYPSQQQLKEELYSRIS